MWVRKGSSRKNEDEVISAIVMPLAGHTDDEVSKFLTKQRAEVRALASGFLSVKATRRALHGVEAIARVEPKTLKQMH
jgi:hypothetical protein